LIRVGDMAYLPRSKQFALVAARFDWLGPHETDRLFLLRALPDGLAFRACSQGLMPWVSPQRPISYSKSVGHRFKETEPPGGYVEFVFSAGRALRLYVECLEAEIRDLGIRWTAKSAPNHPIDRAP